jgi:hypothetical protein
VDTQHRIVKVVSGESATVLSRSAGQGLRELKTQEGIRVTTGLKDPPDTADHGLEQDPEVDATFAGAGQPAGGGANDARVRADDESVRPDGGRKPLEREPWTRQRDETSAQG